jgi:hypothetical protein
MLSHRSMISQVAEPGALRERRKSPDDDPDHAMFAASLGDPQIGRQLVKGDSFGGSRVERRP